MITIIGLDNSGAQMIYDKFKYIIEHIEIDKKQLNPQYPIHRYKIMIPSTNTAKYYIDVHIDNLVSNKYYFLVNQIATTLYDNMGTLDTHMTNDLTNQIDVLAKVAGMRVIIQTAINSYRDNKYIFVKLDDLTNIIAHII